MRVYAEKTTAQAKQSNTNTFYPLEDEITSIVEDANGDLWFGTNDSLIGWRSGNFFTYPIGDPNAPSPANIVKSDSDGGLWAVTGSGVGRIENGEFKLHLENPLNLTRYLSAITADRQNQVRFGYYENVYKIGDGDLLEKYDISNLTTGGIRSMMFDREENLWIGTNGDGLVRLSPRGFAQKLSKMRKPARSKGVKYLTPLLRAGFRTYRFYLRTALVARVPNFISIKIGEFLYDIKYSSQL